MPVFRALNDGMHKMFEVDLTSIVVLLADHESQQLRGYKSGKNSIVEIDFGKAPVEMEVIESGKSKVVERRRGHRRDQFVLLHPLRITGEEALGVYELASDSIFSSSMIQDIEMVLRALSAAIHTVHTRDRALSHCKGLGSQLRTALGQQELSSKSISLLKRKNERASCFWKSASEIMAASSIPQLHLSVSRAIVNVFGAEDGRLFLADHTQGCLQTFHRDHHLESLEHLLAAESISVSFVKKSSDVIPSIISAVTREKQRTEIVSIQGDLSEADFQIVRRRKVDSLFYFVLHRKADSEDDLQVIGVFEILNSPISFVQGKEQAAWVLSMLGEVCSSTLSRLLYEQASVKAMGDIKDKVSHYRSVAKDRSKSLKEAVSRENDAKLLLDLMLSLASTMPEEIPRLIVRQARIIFDIESRDELRLFLLNNDDKAKESNVSEIRLLEYDDSTLLHDANRFVKIDYLFAPFPSSLLITSTSRHLLVCLVAFARQFCKSHALRGHTLTTSFRHDRCQLIFQI